MSPLWKNILVFCVGVVIVGLALAFVQIPNREKSDLSTVARMVEQSEVTSLTVRGGEVEVKTKDGKTLQVNKESTEPLTTTLKNLGVSAQRLSTITLNVEEPSGVAYWGGFFAMNILPYIIVLAVMFFIFRQIAGQSNRALMFGQSTAREQKPDAKDKVTFADVAGVREAKEELKEVVEFLQTPAKFSAVGAKIPKGVLLMGSPGTGKTLLARAVAGEAGVPFFHMSGSEFVEMFVGVGASRVRDLFLKAQKQAPCIVFIDEIDAVGRQRGSGLGGSHDEREQTLNQILVEMDGFEPNAGIIVIAATNRPDVLDPALLRPGRFDRRVVLDPPDLRDREEIMGIHAKNKPLAKEVSLKLVAERTGGFSGADLMNLLNEAAILAARKNATQITQDMILSSIEKVMLGPERRSHVMNVDERKVTAYHEAGHALVAHLMPHADPVQKVSIISRGRAAGYTIKSPTEDRSMRRREEYEEDLAVMLGGYAAEQEIFGDITTGPSNDMKQATRLARSMVTQWGMSPLLGPRVYGEQEDMIFLGREIHENRDYSDTKADVIDTEIDRLIQTALATAKKIVIANREAMDRIVAELIAKETIERVDFSKIVGFPASNPKNV